MTAHGNGIRRRPTGSAPNTSFDRSAGSFPFNLFFAFAVVANRRARSTRTLAGFARVAECGSGVTRYDHRGSLIHDTERALVRIGAKPNARTMRANYGRTKALAS